MRIAFVIDHFHPAKGGAERWVAKVLSGLAARGHEVHLLAMTWSEPLPAAVVGHAVRAPAFPRSLCDRRFAAASAETAAAIGADVSVGVRHVPFVDVFLALGGLYRETLRGNLRARPSLLRRLAYRWLPKPRTLARLEDALLDRPDPPVTIAPSDLVRRHLLERYPRAAARTVVVPHGVDLERFRPAGPRDREALRARLEMDGALAGLFVAHNFELKGLAPLLAAWEDLDPARYRLFVLGRGRPPPGAAALPNVRFLGARDPLDHYRAADVLLHPTFYDVFPLAVIEALACGLPVVTTPWNGLAAEIETARAGLVVEDPRVPAALAAAVRRCAEPGAAPAFARAARELAERFPEAVQVERTIEAITAAALGPQPIPEDERP